MLHSFPTPYPDELWYSVMHRHMVRSGDLGMLKHGGKGTSLSLLYDKSIAEVAKAMPDNLFDVRELLTNHTLFPYITRTIPLDKKMNYMYDLVSGSASVMLWKSSIKSSATLRYCPICRNEEKEKYGECYWHREHQLPLVTVCTKHGCRLKTLGKTRFGQIHFQDDWSDEEVEYEVNPYDILLSEMSGKYLTMPLDVAPTKGYNNLYYSLEKAGYTSIKQCRMKDIDPEYLFCHLQVTFGIEIINKYFGRKGTSMMLESIKNWNMVLPESYILIATLIGQVPEITFGDPIDESQLSFRENSKAEIRKRRIQRWTA